MSVQVSRVVWFRRADSVAARRVLVAYFLFGSAPPSISRSRTALTSGGLRPHPHRTPACGAAHHSIPSALRALFSAALCGDLRLRGTCEDAQVTRELKRAVRTARDRLVASGYTDRDAHRELTKAERQLAAARGESWAEPIDLAAQWDTGAPLPHLVSNGSAAVLICYASAVDPSWDGTYAAVVSPTDPMPAQLLEFTFERCHATKFGGPNDEVISGHPLFSRGLEPYGPHIVHNSPWIAEAERINSVHPLHQGGWSQRLKHYFFMFHDETFEALAADLRVDQVHGVLEDRLLHAVSSVLRD